jgi:starch synthase
MSGFGRGHVRVLMATAELSPFVKVGGLGDAVAGLVKSLSQIGVEVELVMPHYGTVDLADARTRSLDTPDWVGPATVHSGSLPGFERVSLIETPGSQRANPYLDQDGVPWPDLDDRFLAFSAAVARYAATTQPDVVHLNDWHTGAAAGFLEVPAATVLTIHNLAYQGARAQPAGYTADLAGEYELGGQFNALAGAIRLCDRVMTVSPTFAREALGPDGGFGLAELLAHRGTDFDGILNGIDTDVWNPATDPALPTSFDAASLENRTRVKGDLCDEIGWARGRGPLVGMVTRLTDQKGVDLALSLVPQLVESDARMVMLGSGDRLLADLATDLATEHPDHFVFLEGYDEGLSHRIFGGTDFFMMPSRFEPCGLAQMQAMRYGSLPIVTDVGGLHDTVLDADAHPGQGTGFVAAVPEIDALSDAIERALRSHMTPRGDEIRRRGMLRDWSWSGPARQYMHVYQELTEAR